MYLLVPAHLGCPGQSSVSCKWLCVCVLKCNLWGFTALWFNAQIDRRDIHETFLLASHLAWCTEETKCNTTKAEMYSIRKPIK